MALASGFGQDLITPVLPAYLALLGFDRAGIGLIDGLLQGATSVFRFISGILSDRFQNRKQFVFAGYVLSSISRPLLALATSFPAIAALRAIDGVGKGGKDAPRDALIADSTGAAVHGRAFGFHRLVDTAGSVFGPLLAGVILLALTPSLASYRIIFALAAVPGAIALALIAFGIREPSHISKLKTQIHSSLPPTFWIFTLAAGVVALTRVNDSLLLIRAMEFGIGPAWIPVLFAGFTLIYALASYPIGIWSDRVGKFKPIAIGWLLLAIVELGFSLQTTAMGAVALFAVFGLYLALTEGSGRAIIANLVPAESRGSAFAIFHTIVGLSLIAGGFGLGRVWDTISPSFAFQLSSVGALSAFFILTRIKSRS